MAIRKSEVVSILGVRILRLHQFGHRTLKKTSKLKFKSKEKSNVQSGEFRRKLWTVWSLYVKICLSWRNTHLQTGQKSFGFGEKSHEKSK